MCKTYCAMKNEQAIIDGLYEKRALIERECSDVKDELERLTSIMSGYKDRLDAIDKVIAEFDGQNVSDKTLPDVPSENKSDETSFQESLAAEQVVEEQESLVEDEKDSRNGNSNGNGSERLITKGRSSGFRNLVRDEFHNLPTLFTKHDVVALMEKTYPELKGNINSNTMSGVMKSLVKNGYAKVRHKSTGVSSQVYEKKG